MPNHRTVKVKVKKDYRWGYGFHYVDVDKKIARLVGLFNLHPHIFTQSSCENVRGKMCVVFDSYDPQRLLKICIRLRRYFTSWTKSIDIHIDIHEKEYLAFVEFSPKHIEYVTQRVTDFVRE